MRISPVPFIFTLLGAIALFFAFLAAGMGLASLLLALGLGAGGLWLAWRILKSRISQTRDRTA